MSKVKTSVYIERAIKRQLIEVSYLRGESVNAVLNLILSVVLPEMEERAKHERQTLSKKGHGI